jgi:hypothetical protein
MYQLYFSLKKKWVACCGSWICKYMYNQCVSPLNYKRCEFESRLYIFWQCMYIVYICDQVCQWHKGPSWLWSHGSCINIYLCNQCISKLSVRAPFVWVACCGSWICKYMYNQCVSPLNYKRCEFESRWWRGVFDTTLCDEVCQWLLTSWWFLSRIWRSEETPCTVCIAKTCRILVALWSQHI